MTGHPWLPRFPVRNRYSGREPLIASGVILQCARSASLP